MSLNLHAAVRAAITTVNADISAAYLASTGSVANSAGRQVPSYAAPVTVQIQSQPPTQRDLQHLEYLNVQGTTRTVFLYSDPEGIDRVNARGGDLLQFPQFSGAPADNWLVAAAPETWDVGQNALVTFEGIATLTVNSTTLTVTTVTSGTIRLGDLLLDSAGALPANTTIGAFLTGTGGVGTYTLSKSAGTAASAGETVTVAGSLAQAGGENGWTKLYCVLQTDRPA